MKNEIVFENRQNALAVAERLIAENYVVTLSTEEEFTILGYE